jgi:uncharacterized coiled-coil protein SlyX
VARPAKTTKSDHLASRDYGPTTDERLADLEETLAHFQQLLNTQERRIEALQAQLDHLDARRNRL